MLSAVDKLHKLYATTFAPVVAARSAGLEVVNELDGLKSFFMDAAGSREGMQRSSGGWEYAARAVELASATAGVASLLGHVVLSKAAAALRPAPTDK
jgi:ubiquinone biosynthesis monooxygenase Coq6